MINVGIIGTGLIAREHAEAVEMTHGRCKLVAACDLSQTRLDEFATRFNVRHQFSDAQALISSSDVDLVVVATPPSSHESLVVAALEQGKYVLCEKPLAHSLASAKRISEAESRHPGKLSVSYQLRYYPPFRRLSWLVKNNWIGQVTSALIERHNQIPHANGGVKNWWGTWSVSGGGVLITQLIHELDLLIEVMGMPESVQALADTRFTQIESEDYLEATFQFEDGRTTRCVASVNSGTLNGNFQINGDGGTVGLPNRVELTDKAKLSQAIAAADEAVPLPTQSTNFLLTKAVGKVRQRLGVKQTAAPILTPHARLYVDIADRIAQNKALPISSAEAIPSLELCMAVYESVITGKAVSLPLSADSLVYEGVQLQDYVSRQCERDRPSAAFIPAVLPTPVTTPSRVVINAVKRGLAYFGVEPAHIKALLRKPTHVHGGPAARRYPWPRRRHLNWQERRAALRVFNREILFGNAVVYGGAEEEAYCQAFSKYLGGGFADAVNSGSNALYLALRALDLPPGSEVIVPPMTDAGGTMPIAMNLCIPVPADAAPGLLNVSVEQVRAVVSDRTSAIVVAHIAGHPVDMEPILALAAEYAIPVVEDCAQSHGALYKGRMVGTLGAIAAFSTMFGKHHCTGGQGGVVFTRDPELFARVKRAADRGKAFGAIDNPGNMVGSLNFNQDEISTAIGRVQLSKLPNFLVARRQFAHWIAEGLKGLGGISLLMPPEGTQSAYLFLLLKLDLDQLDCDSQGFAQGLALEGIDGVYAGYPVYPTNFPWYREAKVFGDSGIPWSLAQQTPKHYDLPNAHQSNRSLVRIDIHENLRQQEARDLLSAIYKVAQHHRVVCLETVPTLTTLKSPLLHPLKTD